MNEESAEDRSPEKIRKRLRLFLTWSFGLALCTLSASHSYHYIGQSGRYFLFDSIIPILIILGLLLWTLRQRRSS
ncbi:MAG: hypothetical protein AB1898_02765 [Acidobacteriota bacterium]